MKLLTKEIIKALPPLHSTDNVPLENKMVICKFFAPWTNWTWFVFEAEKQEDEDYLFFGMVHGFTKESGYFHFSELASLQGPFGLTIERDRFLFKLSYHLCSWR